MSDTPADKGPPPESPQPKDSQPPGRRSDGAPPGKERPSLASTLGDGYAKTPYGHPGVADHYVGRAADEAWVFGDDRLRNEAPATGSPEPAAARGRPAGDSHKPGSGAPDRHGGKQGDRPDVGGRKEPGRSGDRTAPTSGDRPPITRPESKLAAKDAPKPSDTSRRTERVPSPDARPNERPELAKPFTVVGADEWRDPDHARHVVNQALMKMGYPPQQSADFTKTTFEQGISDHNPQRWHPRYDVKTGDIVGYSRHNSGYWEECDRDGKRVASGERALEEPDIDPQLVFDVATGGGKLVADGAARVITGAGRELFTTAAKEAAKGAAKEVTRDAAVAGGRDTGRTLGREVATAAVVAGAREADRKAVAAAAKEAERRVHAIAGDGRPVLMKHYKQLARQLLGEKPDLDRIAQTIRRVDPVEMKAARAAADVYKQTGQADAAGSAYHLAIEAAGPGQGVDKVVYGTMVEIKTHIVPVLDEFTLKGGNEAILAYVLKDLVENGSATRGVVQHVWIKPSTRNTPLDAVKVYVDPLNGRSIVDVLRR